MKRKRRRRPMDLRYEAKRQVIARLLLLGWTAEKIAKRIGRTARAVRYTISTAKFQTLFARLQREYLGTLDRKMSRLLYSAVRALAKMLKHPDWRARDAAAEKILKLHGRHIEKLDLTGSLDLIGRTRPGLQGQQPMDDMTPERCYFARQLLKASRAAYAATALSASLGQRP